MRLSGGNGKVTRHKGRENEMKNKDIKVGVNVTVCGYRGVVTSVERLGEFQIEYDGKPVGTGCYSMEAVESMRSRGYTVTPTGRNGTYFTVDFSGEPSLKGTAYDGGCYGCLDDFECYGTW